MRWLLLISLSCAVAWAAANEPVVRDAALWPFSSTSPWNIAIGDQAVYQPIASPRFACDRGGSLNCAGFSHPVFLAGPSDPEVRISRRGTATPFATARVPAEAKPDSHADGHLHIIDPGRRKVIEMFGARRETDGGITATAVVENDLTDDGIYPAWHGVRAYGGSALAGLIRTGELTNGIRHALAIAVEQQALNRQGPLGKAWVWPASSCDNNNSYSTSGNLFMGSLLAIPAGVDLKAAGLRGPALEMGIALQDYGAYITDCTGSNLSFYAEPAAAAEVGEVGRGDVAKLVSLLQVVANNSPQNVGGGGKRRRPSAPPFAPPGQAIVDGGLPPRITAEPSALSVQAGAAVRMSVAATGSEPLTYKWRRSGVAVGGNQAELAIASARPGDAGTYVCTVSNAYGRVATAGARVTVVGGDASPQGPSAETMAAWRERLLSTVRAAVAAGGLPQYRSELMRSRVSIREVDTDDGLTVLAGGATMLVAWKQLKTAELASLAEDLARAGGEERHAIAAFFLLAAGEEQAAGPHLDRAAGQAEAVRSVFVRK